MSAKKVDAGAWDIPQAPIPEDKLELLTAKAHLMVTLEEDIERMGEALKEVTKALHDLRTRQVPDLMMELQVDSLTLKGFKIAVGDFVSGSLPKDPDKRQKAFAWLDTHDASGLIVTDVEVSFPRSEREKAKEVANYLWAMDLPAKLNSNVHPQTLAKFARDKLKSGEAIDLETLGLFSGKIAKVTRL